MLRKTVIETKEWMDASTLDDLGRELLVLLKETERNEAPALRRCLRKLNDLGDALIDLKRELNGMVRVFGPDEVMR